MIAALRKQADEAAQAALRAMVDYRLTHGVRNVGLEREYERMERLVDMIDEHITLTQAEDLDGPDDEFPGAIPPQDLRLMADPGDHYAWPA